MSLGHRLLAVGFALMLGVVAIGLMRGEVPVGIRGSKETIEGAPVVLLGILALVGACWALYAAITGQ